MRKFSLQLWIFHYTDEIYSGMANGRVPSEELYTHVRYKAMVRFILMNEEVSLRNGSVNKCRQNNLPYNLFGACVYSRKNAF